MKKSALLLALCLFFASTSHPSISTSAVAFAQSAQPTQTQTPPPPSPPPTTAYKPTTKSQKPAPTVLSNDNHYTNSSGNVVHSPAKSSGGIPAGLQPFAEMARTASASTAKALVRIMPAFLSGFDYSVETLSAPPPLSNEPMLFRSPDILLIFSSSQSAFPFDRLVPGIPFQDYPNWLVHQYQSVFFVVFAVSILP
jgi:hypothetical protein